MKALGLFLIFGGIVYLVFAFNMDVGVEVPSTYVPGFGSIGGGSVANVDLMATRQNHLSVAGLITFIGVMFAIFGKAGTGTGQVTVLPSPATHSMPFEGVRNLNNDAYRLMLSKFYQIERNDVFGKYVIGEKLVDTLDEALAQAHQLEGEKFASAAAAEEARRAYIKAKTERHRIASERVVAKWRDRAPEAIIALIVIAGLISGVLALFRESSAERAARERVENAELVRSVPDRFAVKLPRDATNVEVTEKAELYPFFCGEQKNGTLLTFETRLSEKEVQGAFAQTLGKGKPQHELLDQNFDWTWQKGQVNYELSMLNEQPPLSVNLCMFS